jgi:hypothetical protein
MLSVRITSPPTSKEQYPTTAPQSSNTPQLLANPDFFATETSTVANNTKHTAPAVPVGKHLPSPRVDSGIGQERPSDVEKPLPALDKNQNTLDLTQVNEKLTNPRESGHELKDWLALSRMLDDI